eukprot:SAG31_NODE_4009_length_3668_cov_17.056598_4_plen_128_part_00
MGQLKLIAAALAEIPPATLVQALMAPSTAATRPDGVEMDKGQFAQPEPELGMTLEQQNSTASPTTDLDDMEAASLTSSQPVPDGSVDVSGGVAPAIPAVVQNWINFVSGKLTDVLLIDSSELAGFRR